MTNARWQRWLVAAQVLLGLALAAGAWWGWRSPWLALAGWLAVPLLLRLYMAQQFLLMAWVSRHDAATPRLRPGALLRAWWAEAHWAARVFGWWQPFRHRAVPDWLPAPQPGAQPAPRGVVLVHGFLCNRGFWMPWLALLRARGHAFVAVTLEPAFGPIDGYAPQIDDAVRRVAAATGRAPLIIGHSMGGLAVRAWLRAQGEGEGAGAAAAAALARVHRVVTLGTPHAGTWPARYSRSANGRQMAPGSAWLQALERAESAALRARCVCWYSHCDNVVYPPATARLAGADNRFLPGVAHVEMAFHPQVVQGCLRLLEEGDSQKQ